MKYAELKAKHQEEVNAFPFMFAFGAKQFDEMLKKNNLTINDIYSIGAGGYIRKSDADAMEEMFKRHRKEMKEAMKSQEFLRSAFLYEMANHEYGFTHDSEEVLRACGITEEEFQKNDYMKKAWREAEKAYRLFNAIDAIDDNWI